jgi:hypothetical protein
MPTATQYARQKLKWETNKEEFEKERERIRQAQKARYNSDPEYAKKRIEYQKERYRKMKALQTV